MIFYYHNLLQNYLKIWKKSLYYEIRCMPLQEGELDKCVHTKNSLQKLQNIQFIVK
jgi:hypothetical protein